VPAQVQYCIAQNTKWYIFVKISQLLYCYHGIETVDMYLLTCYTKGGPHQNSVNWKWKWLSDRITRPIYPHSHSHPLSTAIPWLDACTHVVNLLKTMYHVDPLSSWKICSHKQFEHSRLRDFSYWNDCPERSRPLIHSLPGTGISQKYLPTIQCCQWTQPRDCSRYFSRHFSIKLNRKYLPNVQSSFYISPVKISAWRR